MIEVSNVSVMNWMNAMRGARNAFKSWDRMDSTETPDGGIVLGPNDLNLATRLAKSGSDHRKFLRQIFVSIDIKAPLYWWKEFDTYKIGTTANSTSTMHTLHNSKITVDDFSTEHISPTGMAKFRELIDLLETLRQTYLSTKDKQIWYEIIQILPSSFMQTRTCSLNYENLVNIHHSRKDHKLDEWRIFCEWIETLPYANNVILINKQHII